MYFRGTKLRDPPTAPGTYTEKRERRGAAGICPAFRKDPSLTPLPRQLFTCAECMQKRSSRAPLRQSRQAAVRHREKQKWSFWQFLAKSPHPADQPRTATRQLMDNPRNHDEQNPESVRFRKNREAEGFREPSKQKQRTRAFSVVLNLALSRFPKGRE